MASMSLNLKKTFLVLFSIYILFCLSIFLLQEKLIFIPQKLPAEYEFQFHQKFEEVYISVDENIKLHGLLFKADSSKGVIFYLHGNGGAADSWGNSASTFLDMQYDFFVLDYRGYGKSEGSISGELQFIDDAQHAYNEIKKRYDEDKIIIAGYSIGTGVASYLASVNRPGMLLLQAPYYCLAEIAQNRYPFIPDFLLKYRFETYRYVSKTNAPILIVHGRDDRVIPVESSYRLHDRMKPNDKLIVIDGLGHNGMNDNILFKKELQQYIHGLK